MRSGTLWLAVALAGCQGRCERWFVDSDGDGYGDADSDGVEVCGGGGGEKGHVPNGLDCDDADAEVHPDAAELCAPAGVDEDCDGALDGQDDSAELLPHWPDGDGDGHGDPLGDSALACEAPGGRSLTDDDCDDADASVFPGAPERCDGRPNDCSAPIASEVGLITVAGAPFPSLQEALDAAAAGDEVQLCEGVYEGTFVAPVAVSLVGAGRELTTLDAGDAGTVLTVPPGSRLSGLTLTQGQADVGGGLMLTEAGELVVEDCDVMLNEARRGGGVALPAGSTASFPGTLVQLNTAVEGGGIFAGQGAVLDLTGAQIDDNRADYGGGLSGAELTVVGGLVTNNSAEDNSGSPYFLGGAGMVLVGSSTLTGTEIAFNDASDSSGGGISMSGGDLTLIDVWVHDNDGGYEGGGIELEDASGLFEGTTVIGPANVSDVFGGGVSISGGGLQGGEIQGNASDEGGGVFAVRSELHDLWVHDNAGETAGGIGLRGGTLADSVVEANTGQWTAGLRTDSGSYGPVTVSDTAITGNRAPDGVGGVSIEVDDAPDTLFTRVTLTDNEGRHTGAIAVYYGRARLVDSTVLRNLATEGEAGGGRLAFDGALEVTGTDFGAGADDNSPSDVSTPAAGVFHGYGADSTFTCNSNGCTPTP
jgi:hypothetical protein